jgi:hypothetical protein
MAHGKEVIRRETPRPAGLANSKSKVIMQEAWWE